MFKKSKPFPGVKLGCILLLVIPRIVVFGNDLEVNVEHNQYYFEEINPPGNISFGIIEDIQEDQYGFIWIGSKDGLFRYDGCEFVAYYHKREDSTSLSSNIVRDLFLDGEGKLWIGTENGLNKYNDSENNFQRFFFPEATPMATNIRKITEHDNSLLVATIDGGLIILDPISGSIEQYSNSSGGNNLSSNSLRDVFIDSEGIMWLASIDRGVDYKIPGESDFRQLPVGSADGKHLNGTNVQGIVEMPDNEIWIGTRLHGISIYNKKSRAFRYLQHEENNPGSLSSNTCANFFIDSRKQLWVCTDGGGLNLYDSEEQKFTRFRADNSFKGSISSDVVRVIYEDRASNYWIGNYSGPINYLDANRKDFGLVRKNGFRNAFLNSNDISAVFVDSKGELWIGNNGLTNYKPHTNEKTYYAELPVHQGGKGARVPLCFDEDANGNIWIGTFDASLFCYRRSENRFVHYSPENTGGALRGYQIWDVMVQGDSVWIASDRGLDVYLMSIDEFANFPVEKNNGLGTSTPGIWKLYKDREGRILVGTIQGLNVFDPYLKRFSYHEPLPNDYKSISDKWVLSIYEDSRNRTWIGTNGGGLNLWNEADNSFTCFTIDDGLSGNVINSILEDETGKLWLSTNNGITKFDYDSLSFDIFDERDGLQDNRFNINVACTDEQGNFYFGGINGLNVFDPSSIKKNDYRAPVYITGFEISNKKAGIGKADSPFKKNFHLQDAIELTHKQSVFTIHFATLNYSLSGKNQYRYILEGFDEDWHLVGNQTEATYTHLSPGKYSFVVEAANNDGLWNPEAAVLGIVVHPVFYRSWWFLTLLGLFVVGLVYRIYRHRVINMREVNTRLSALVDERTSEIERRKNEIADQNKEIVRQRDIATSQRDKILAQKEELEEHRHRLEELVEERTRELVEAKDNAEESDRLKTAFLENISHEIRTPMNAIVGFINLLGEKINDEQSRDYYMRIIQDSGKNMLHLVQDVIDFSKMQIGQLEPEYSECDAKQLIRETVTGFRERASRNNPNLSILAELPNEDVKLFTDEKKLVQIFSKLLENSLRLTEAGHIKIGIKEISDKQITFFVEDTGPGIEKEILNSVFDRFFMQNQVEANDSRNSGLGLAFTKLATEIMGGKIWVESEQGSGSVFYFTLPFIQIRNNSFSFRNSEKSDYSWPGSRILVAEDEESNYLLIEAILKDTKVKLIHAKDGVELLEKIEKEENIDLVLLDLKMPRMSGINAMKIIRESHSDVPVIVQTAYDHTNHRELCNEIGCNDFLVKPLRKKELLETLAKFLA